MQTKPGNKKGSSAEVSYIGIVNLLSTQPCVSHWHATIPLAPACIALGIFPALFLVLVALLALVQGQFLCPIAYLPIPLT